MVGSSTRQWLLNSAIRRPETELLILTNCIQSFKPYRLYCQCKYFGCIFLFFSLISRVDWPYGLNKYLNIFLSAFLQTVVSWVVTQGGLISEYDLSKEDAVVVFSLPSVLQMEIKHSSGTLFISLHRASTRKALSENINRLKYLSTETNEHIAARE